MDQHLPCLTPMSGISPCAQDAMHNVWLSGGPKQLIPRSYTRKRTASWFCTRTGRHTQACMCSYAISLSCHACVYVKPMRLLASSLFLASFLLLLKRCNINDPDQSPQLIWSYLKDLYQNIVQNLIKQSLWRCAYCIQYSALHCILWHNIYFAPCLVWGVKVFAKTFWPFDY